MRAEFLIFFKRQYFRILHYDKVLTKYCMFEQWPILIDKFNIYIYALDEEDVICIVQFVLKWNNLNSV